MNFFKKAVRSFLWRSGLGRGTAARFWKVKDSGPGFHEIYRNKKEVFNQLPFGFDDPVLEDFLRKDSQRWNLQEEYVVRVDDVLIEPERCLGIRNFNELVDQTVVYKFDFQYPYILPYLLNRHRAIRVQEAVLYDGSATRNYYHHFVNAVNSIWMLERSGLPSDIPFIINRASFDKNFFQFLYKRSKKFREINWLIQEPGQWLRVGRMYKMQCLHFDPAPWKRTQELYQLEPVVPYRKVFLNRDKSRYDRCLSNEAEIVSVMEKLGFEHVFAEHLTIEEQTELFRDTKYLVALSGMGLIQQFFMNPEHAHILEILPLNRLMPEYYWQSQVLGIDYYDIIVAGPMNEKTHYHLDPAKLEAAVRKMLQLAVSVTVSGSAELLQQAPMV